MAALQQTLPPPLLLTEEEFFSEVMVVCVDQREDKSDGEAIVHAIMVIIFLFPYAVPLLALLASKLVYKSTTSCHAQ